MKKTSTTTYSIWAKNLRKFAKLKRQLEGEFDFSIRTSIELKIKAVVKTILKLKRRFSLKIATTALLSALAITPALSQTSIDLDNDNRVEQVSTDAFTSVGDINNDGFEDFGKAVSSGGSYFIMFGDGTPFPDNIDMNTVDPGDGIYLTSSDSYGFANQVEALEDFNGDGINDVAIFEYAKEYSGNHPSYVLFGSDDAFPDSLDLANMSNGDGIELIASGNYWGDDLESGDINGDGVSDLILAVWDAEKIEVLFGKKTGFPTKDISWSASLNGTDGTTFIDDFDDKGFSCRNVSVPGDINGDGYDDIVFNTGLDWYAVESKNGVSELVTIYGRAQFPLALKTSEIDGNNGFVLQLNTGAVRVGSAGDLNGDGLVDVSISPYKEYSTEITDSTSFIFYGECGNRFPHNTNITKFLKLTNGEVIHNTIFTPNDTKIDHNQDGFNEMAYVYNGVYNVLNSTVGEGIINCITTKLIGKIYLAGDETKGLRQAEIKVEGLGSFYTGVDGTYEIVVPSKGNYDLSYFHSSENVDFVTDVETVSLPNEGDELEVDNQYNFINEYDDVSVTISSGNIPRPGFDFNLFIDSKNLGTDAYNNSIVTLTLPTEYNLETLPLGATQIGNTLTWDVTDMPQYQVSRIRIAGSIDATTPLAKRLLFITEINGSDINDADLSNNIDILKSEVRGSYDPNDKTTLSVIAPEFIENGEYLDYLIRFQNTGTDTAFTVVVTDTLSADLQWNTFELISTSHGVKVSREDSILHFRFDDILLVDSTANEVESHGYIRFKIKPESSLVEGDFVEGKANIYFDYNLPVITNNMRTDVKVEVTALDSFESEENLFEVFPNPTAEFITIQGEDKELQWELRNTQGTLLDQGSSTQVSLTDYALGIYIITINGVSYQLMKY
jgi:uncharacterized repeat protein (TIGR01451 family)